MNKHLKNMAKAIGALPALLTMASASFAASWQPTGATGFTDLDSFISNALTVAVLLAALIAVVFLIINGINYITSAGDQQKTEIAQKGIIAALIGLVVVGIAYLLVNFIVTRVLRTELTNVD